MAVGASLIERATPCTSMALISEGLPGVASVSARATAGRPPLPPEILRDLSQQN